MSVGAAPPVETLLAPPVEQQIARLDDTQPATAPDAPPADVTYDDVQPSEPPPADLPAAQTKRTKALKQVAALSPAPSAAAPARSWKPRVVFRPAARPSRVAARPAPRVRTASYRVRSVQNLFLHPLGRL
jgi:hypothetical protein